MSVRQITLVVAAFLLSGCCGGANLPALATALATPAPSASPAAR
ncbi:MAG: hypothetical protein JWM80_587 [Cyanobacteria bacterium RYN_339]|nr:hypothetical protein [Cyanobacteria bacterium RYN_339]